ncbi:MAG: hypothetical protein ALECFALPRED_006731 [Alectoria fallacina]|uniref:MYND-type domain-containing protein n=1 Tax=Alectoria fallacina TaxID=1903189 RepID=A0A8H3GAT2_9LECA|nr:MAG: hypothetical protein ALECFALPRED_006731 [Alectoria fallacina]
MALSFIPRCSYCDVSGSDSKLFPCQACKVVSYCGRDHQVAHRENHKHACNAIKKSQQTLDREETKLRSHPGDFMTPPNLFEEQAGHFWGILETRGYMRARYALVDALLKIKTHAAVEAARVHVMDILRLCRSDNMGVRDLVPALDLRLGRDQECYDFCKWWATTGQEGDYDWGNMDNPYLDVKNADVFEPPLEDFLSQYSSLSHSAAITLLKIRLLMDVRALQNSSMIGSKVPQEILDSVRGQLVSGSVISDNQSIMNAKDQAPLIEKLEVQVQNLYTAVKNSNKHFWPALLNPGKHLTARSEAYSRGSSAQMQVVLQYSFDAWMETPGAVDVIKELVRNNS